MECDCTTLWRSGNHPTQKRKTEYIKRGKEGGNEGNSWRMKTMKYLELETQLKTGNPYIQFQVSSCLRIDEICFCMNI